VGAYERDIPPWHPHCLCTVIERMKTIEEIEG